MKECYIDLHTHSSLSDGAYSARKLCQLAREAGLGILAITDHNATADLTGLQTEFPDLHLIQGTEISCMYTEPGGGEWEIHVVGLGFDPVHPAILGLLARNQPDRAPYINAILNRLQACGIELGTYEQICAQKEYVGRRDLAQLMKNLGYVDTVEEAFDVYLGAFGQRRAYVPKPSRYVSLEDAVSAIRQAGGAAVLAHLYYMPLTDPEALVRRFRELAGDAGGLEVYYKDYDEDQRRSLKVLADRYHLMYSAASDYHGQCEGDTLHTGFTASSCQELLEYLSVCTNISPTI